MVRVAESRGVSPRVCVVRADPGTVRSGGSAQHAQADVGSQPGLCACGLDSDPVPPTPQPSRGARPGQLSARPQTWRRGPSPRAASLPQRLQAKCSQGLRAVDAAPKGERVRASQAEHKHLGPQPLCRVPLPGCAGQRAAFSPRPRP